LASFIGALAISEVFMSAAVKVHSRKLSDGSRDLGALENASWSWYDRMQL